MMDSLLGQRYEVCQEIGRGGYGQVCTGYDHEIGRKVAIKLEKVDKFEGEINYLQKEEEVYSKLKGEESFGIANIHHFGAELIQNDSDDGLDDNGYVLRYMVMDLLGPDLEELFTECSKKFSLETVLLLAGQMIRIIQYVHSKDYIHGDIKPRNFVLGQGKKGSNMIYMVDFGLAQRYRDSQTKEHIVYSDTTSYAGTMMFTSLNCHQHIQQSRRDDLESLGYVLLYFLGGSLPWQAIKDWNDKSEKRQLVYKKKASISIEELCTGLPCEFVRYMEYCRSLQFDQEPDYDYLRKLFQDLYDQAGFTDVLEYDWMLRQRKVINYSDDTFTDKYFLESNLNSSNIDAEDVFYYFNVVYNPIEEPELSLETTEECLEHIFKFVAGKNNLQINSENDFKWDNMSMSDIVEHYTKNNEDIAWIHQFDRFDWKTATEEIELVMRKFFAYYGEVVNKPALFFMQSAYGVYINMGEKGEGVKRFFDSVAALASHQSYLRNDSCVEHLHLMISEDMISDASHFLESRHIEVTVKPDGVFINPTNTGSKLSMLLPRWEIVIEIYDASAEKVLKKQEDEGSLVKSPSSVSSLGNDSVCDPVTLTSTPTKSQSLEVENIPELSYTSDKGITILSRRPDIIADKRYRRCVREHIARSLPATCRDHLHTIKKMGGHHVLQLFAQFKRRHIMTKRPERSDIENNEQSIGMFAVNEFIYFSRLDVSCLVYKMIVGGDYSSMPFHHKAMQIKESPPVVTFSNFRLDITKKNHRLALVLFLKKYLYPKMNIKGYPSKEEENEEINQMLEKLSI